MRHSGLELVTMRFRVRRSAGLSIPGRDSGHLLYVVQCIYIHYSPTVYHVTFKHLIAENRSATKQLLIASADWLTMQGRNGCLDKVLAYIIGSINAVWKVSKLKFSIKYIYSQSNKFVKSMPV